MSLYTPGGWLNIPWLASQGAWLYVIVGARQVGKTYGVSKYLLDTGGSFIYMRRTAEELDLISSSPDLDPWKNMEQEGYFCRFSKDGKSWSLFTYEHPITEGDNDNIPTLRGRGLALSTVGKLRGFSGGVYSDIMFDEFIPEKIQVRRKQEGDAFLNAYVTINGNRELSGKPPLRCWLLANANDISSPILEALGLTNRIAEMRRTDKEVSIKDGVALVSPLSHRITEKRKQTALMRYLTKNGISEEFTGMALDNTFNYDDVHLIKPRDTKGWRQICRYGDKLYFWTNDTSLYVTTSGHNRGKYYPDTTDGRNRLTMDALGFKTLYERGSVTFQNAKSMILFRDIWL